MTDGPFRLRARTRVALGGAHRLPAGDRRVGGVDRDEGEVPVVVGDGGATLGEGEEGGDTEAQQVAMRPAGHRLAVIEATQPVDVIGDDRGADRLRDGDHWAVPGAGGEHGDVDVGQGERRCGFLEVGTQMVSGAGHEQEPLRQAPVDIGEDAFPVDGLQVEDDGDPVVEGGDTAPQPLRGVRLAQFGPGDRRTQG